MLNYSVAQLRYYYIAKPHHGSILYFTYIYVSTKILFYLGKTMFTLLKVHIKSV